MNLQSKIDYSIALLRKCKQMALDYDPENGFYLAFSGGKDSQALYHLAVMAGVKFKAHMSLTSVDPPEVIRFVKQNYPDVELIKPKISIYDMALKKHLLPTRSIRWCCAEFKEISGAGKVTLIGVRKAESTRRSKREEIELSGHKFSGNFDQFSEHKEKMVTCVGGLYTSSSLIEIYVYSGANTAFYRVMSIPTGSKNIEIKYMGMHWCDFKYANSKLYVLPKSDDSSISYKVSLVRRTRPNFLTIDFSDFSNITGEIITPTPD